MEVKTRQTVVREIAKALFPAAITAGILFLALALKQIYPFGENTIDYYDMGQQEAALYYHAWDFLHGDKSAFFDWYSGLSVNMSSVTTGFNIISGLFLLCVERTAVFRCLSLLVVLRLSLCALTMYLCLREESGADYRNQVLFSVLYALSGYCLQYYVISTFSEISIFFPLLFLFFMRMLRGKDYIPYILLLVCSMVTSYYMCAMVLIFFIMAAGLYLLLFVEKSQRKKVILRLGLSTATGILISCFLFVPQIMQTSSSSRFTNDAGGISQYLKILKNEYGSYTSRWWHLLNMTPAVVITCIGCYTHIRKKQGRKQVVFLLGMTGLVGIALVSESVSLMLHFGSYIQFPLRNGFILCFALCLSGAVFSKDLVWKGEKEGIAGGIKIVGAGMICILAAALLLRGYFYSDTWEFRRIFHVSVLCCAVLSVCYFILILLSRKMALWSVFAAVVFTEAFVTSMLLVGKPHYTTGYAEEPEQDRSYVETTLSLVKSLPIEPGEVDRIKNPDTSLNANYPFVMRRAALSNWTHLIDQDHQKSVEKLGYTTHFTRLLDSGGTVFSDALLRVTQAVSLAELDERLYDVRSEAMGYRLYDCRYTLPFGLAVSEDVQDLTLKKKNFISLQNDLYALATGDSDLIEVVSTDEEWEETEDGGLRLTVPVTEEGILYFKCVNGTEDEDYLKITVNGTELKVPTITEPSHTKYPAHFNNGVQNLGIYENENVTVEIEPLMGVKPEDLHITMGLLKLQKLRKLCDAEAGNDTNAAVSGRKLTLTASGDADRNRLLIPVTYHPGFRVKVNGEQQPAYKVLGAFTAVPLKEGNNVIEITFVPKGIAAGICLSLTGLLLLLAAVLIRRRYGTIDPGPVQAVAGICFWAVFAGIGIFVYVIPAIANFAAFILKIAM